MKRINQLSTNLINQIAAGEVIERPASVVKELVENSIDAGATKVEIEISNECRNIRVADNGSGIHKDDIILAFSRHATSKILEEKDLWGISTLGFRGEALASIISIAKVICTTRTKDSEVGTKVECSDSNVKTSETGCAKGTIMEIKDLFYNTPVRLKFLKKAQTEYASILEIIQGIAISNPHVALTLISKNHRSLKTTGSNNIAVVVSEVYSADLVKDLAEVYRTDEVSGYKISGYASNPDFTRSNKKAIYTFVNGRMVKCPIMLRAIDTVYRDMIPSGKHPFIVINLELPNGEVDVNVHPSKREIRYANTNQVYGFVYGSVKAALEHVYLQRNHFAAQEDNSFSAFEAEEYSEQKTVNAQPEADFAQYSESVDFRAFVSEERVEQARLDIASVEPGHERPKAKIIGQLLNTYILIEHPEGLQVIDQHIAHERYLYEKLQESKTTASQLLLTSDVIELEPADIELIDEKREILNKFGYEIQSVSESEVIFKQVPQVIASKHPEGIMEELLEALRSSENIIEDKILETTACKASVKAGEKLSIWQMDELIANWQTTKFPKTCPHGRIISHIIPSKEIANFFGRPEVSSEVMA